MGVILFDELSEHIKKCEIEAGTEMGANLAFEEPGRTAAKPAPKAKKAATSAAKAKPTGSLRFDAALNVDSTAAKTAKDDSASRPTTPSGSRRTWSRIRSGPAATPSATPKKDFVVKGS